MTKPIFSEQDTQFMELLRGCNPRGPWGMGIIATLVNATPEVLQSLRVQLVSQWLDDPKTMFSILRFDLPKFLGMKMLSVEELNKELACRAVGYRVTEEIRVSDRKAEWLGRVGYMEFAGVQCVMWVDSLFNRYIQANNGQLFECTNTDLTSLPEVEKQHTRALLTGLMD